MEAFRTWFLSNRALLGPNVSIEEAYAALVESVEAKLPPRPLRRYPYIEPVFSTPRTTMGSIGQLPADVRRILYFRYGLLVKMASLSSWFVSDTKPYLESLHHSHITGKEVARYLLGLHRAMTENLDVDGESPIGMVARRLDAMHVSRHTLRDTGHNAGRVVSYFQFAYTDEDGTCSHHKYTLLTRRRPPSHIEFGMIRELTEYVDGPGLREVAPVMLYLVVRRLRSLGSREVVVPRNVMIHILRRRRACIRREEAYPLNMATRLVHRQLTEACQGMTFSLEELVGYRLATSPPRTLPTTTRLVDVHVGDEQWEEEDLERIRDTIMNDETDDDAETERTRLENLHTLLYVLAGGKPKLRMVTFLGIVELLDSIKNDVYKRRGGKLAMMKGFDKRFGTNLLGGCPDTI